MKLLRGDGGVTGVSVDNGEVSINLLPLLSRGLLAIQDLGVLADASRAAATMKNATCVKSRKLGRSPNEGDVPSVRLRLSAEMTNDTGVEIDFEVSETGLAPLPIRETTTTVRTTTNKGSTDDCI